MPDIKPFVVQDLRLVREVMFSEGLKDVVLAETPDAYPGLIQYEPSVLWIGVDSNDGLIGLFKLTVNNEVLAGVHPWILKKWWGTGKSLDAANALFTFLKEQTSIRVLETAVPEPLPVSQRYADRLGFKQAYVIAGGSMLSGKRVNLIKYTREL